MIESLAPGLSFLALHVTRPGEIEAIDPGFTPIRTGEYALFRSSAFRDWLQAQGLELVGMRALRDELRRSEGKGQDGSHRRRPDRHGVHGQVPRDGLWRRPGRLWRRPA